MEKKIWREEFIKLVVFFSVLLCLYMDRTLSSIDWFLQIAEAELWAIAAPEQALFSSRQWWEGGKNRFLIVLYYFPPTLIASSTPPTHTPEHSNSLQLSSLGFLSFLSDNHLLPNLSCVLKIICISFIYIQISLPLSKWF